jgi:hypothetical protein
MQTFFRKGRILNKKGFGLWQAIMIILIISGLMIVVLQYSRIAAKHTADTYVREQAELYLNSVLEMTLLRISLQDKTTCLSSYVPPAVTKNGVEYSGNVDIVKYYLLNGVSEFGSCGIVENIQTEETHGMALMQIEVIAKVDGNTSARILRRTLQRP